MNSTSPRRLRSSARAVATVEYQSTISRAPRRSLAAWLAVLAGVAVMTESLPAQQRITGTQETAPIRGFVNFKAAATRAAKLQPGPLWSAADLVSVPRTYYVDSNGVPVIEPLSLGVSNAPKAVHSPMPLDRIVPATNAPRAEPGPYAPMSPRVLPVPSPPPAASFQALDDNNTSIPPDTMGAVGPRHLMVVHNTEVRVQDRFGGEVSRMPLNAFWQSAGFPDAFDPKVYFDAQGGRWIFVAMADGATLLGTSGTLIAVSQTDDPTGNWFMWRVPVDLPGIIWADYPSVGFNKDWIVVTANMFPVFGSGYAGEYIYVFNKADLYANGLGNYTFLPETSGRGFTMVPSVSHDTASDTIYLVEVDNLITNFTSVSSRLRLSTITGPVGGELLTVGTAFVNSTNVWGSSDPSFQTGFPFGGFLPQRGSPFGISANDCRVQNVVLRNGSLWLAHHVFLPAFNPSHVAVQWWQLSPSGAVVQRGAVEDPLAPVSYAFPNIAVNARNDVLIGFSRFSTNQYASASYTVRFGLDPLGEVRQETILKLGEAPYFKTYGGFRNRWGDYSASMVDPVNDVDFWTIQEYAAAPLGGWDRWGTWWGHVVMGDLTQFAQPFYTVIEGQPPGFASIAVYNFGGAAGSVAFSTSDGTAIQGIDYLPRNGVLNFEAGQFATNFDIIILDNALTDSNRTVNLHLTDATGALTLGSLSNAVLTIQDDETIPPPSPAGELNFSSYLDIWPYEVTENETFPYSCGNAGVPPWHRSALGALITVVRTNGNTGRVLVDYATVPGGTAVPYIDYTPTNGTLVFDDFQMSTNFVVPVWSDFISNGHKIFYVQLSNPRPDPQEDAQRPGLIRPILGGGALAPVVIYEINHGTPAASGINLTNLSYTRSFAFERRWWRMDEYGNNRDPRIPGGLNAMNISVIITPGSACQVQVILFNRVAGFQLQAGSDYAQAPPGNPWFTGEYIWPNSTYTPFDTLTTITNLADYMPTNFTLGFGQNQCRANFTIYVTNDTEVEFNEDIIMEIRQLGGQPPVNPYASIANVTILHDDQSAGALDREWNPDDIAETVPQFNLTPGANNIVAAVAIQMDGGSAKTILGGDFTTVNAQPRNRVARLNFDGSLDTTFQSGTGADGLVSSVIVYPSSPTNTGKILIGGGFTSYNGAERSGIARLLPNGQLDPTFLPLGGANGPVRAMTLQADGRIVIAGNFNQVNYVDRYGIARLNPDGSLDQSFVVPGTPDGTIWALNTWTANDGAPEKILIGGDFFYVGTNFFGGIARLNGDGSLDAGFNPGLSADGPVYAVAVQTNRSIYIGGGFFSFDNRSRIGLARLLPDGALDTTFDPAGGVDNPIYSIVVDTNQQPLIGGSFMMFNGTRRMGLARLRRDGALDTSFLDTAFNHFAGLPRKLSFDPPNYVASIALQPDGNVMIGGSFTNVGGNPSYSKLVPNHYTVFTRADKRPRYNIARLFGTTTPGPGNAEYALENFFADENSARAKLRLERTDGRLGTLMAEAGTFDRTATNLVDYVSTNLLAIWPQSFFQTNIDANAQDFGITITNFAPLGVGRTYPIYLEIPILDNQLRDGDRTLDLSFLRPDGNIVLGGEYIPLGGALGRSKANLTIGDNDFPAGTFTFATTAFVTNEDKGSALITVIRTNGSVGPVTVDYFTTTLTAPPVATPATLPDTGDYTTTRGTLFFASGQTNRTFTVPLRNDTAVEFDENIGLVLTNATGGARLPGSTPVSIATSTLTIIDNDFPFGRLNFALSGFTTNEKAPAATITVTRTGGDQRALTTQFRAVSGSAIPGLDWLTNGTSGTLSWNDGDAVPRSFTVPLLADGRADGARTVLLFLTNATVNATNDPRLFGIRSNATLTIIDDDKCGTYLFSQSFYQADENGGQVSISVLRRDGIAETNEIDWSIIPVDPLSPGMDYVAANGVLQFLPGEISKTFNIALLDDDQADGNKDLVLLLSNPKPTGCAQLGSPSTVTLTLVDNESFNTPAGSLDTTFNPSAKTDGPVYALALQPNGSLLLAGDFTEVNDISRNGVARLLPDGAFDASFDLGPGADAAIRAMTLQPDGRVLLGGLFTQIVGTNRSRIGRVYHDGTLDASFNPGSGADNPVYAITLQPDGRILVGGSFNKFNGITRPNLVRLTTNGTVDVTFSTGSGLDGTVFAIAMQDDGKILIGGEFTRVNGTNRFRIARLLPNGALDLSFDPAGGMNAAVRAILFQPDGRIVAGGSFTGVNGTPRNYLARLNQDGSLDTDFLSLAASPNNVGANDSVYALALQVDGKILAGGDFTAFNNVTRKRLTRLRSDGTTDPTINFGNGANSFIAALLLQPDRKIVLGGGFTTYDDQLRRFVARVYGGSIDGAGEVEYAAPEYTVSETETNVIVSVRRVGGTTGRVTADYFTGGTDDTAVPGFDYLPVNGTLEFIEGETRQIFSVPILPDTRVLEGDRFFAVHVTNFTGGAGPGPQPFSKVIIQDSEAIVGFTATYYSVNKNDIGGRALINVYRLGNTNTTVTVSYATVEGGTATPAVDYWPTAGQLVFLPGQTNLTFNVTIIRNDLLQGLRTVSLMLSNVQPALANQIGLANATLSIVDDKFSGGQISFLPAAYSVNEYEPYVTLTLVRTNGSSGVVSLRYSTYNITATAGIDYGATNNVALSFFDGETSKQIRIPIINDALQQPDHLFGVTIFNPQGAVLLGPATNGVVTIVDDDTQPYVKFAQTNYVVNEGQGNALITVIRGGAPTNAIAVSYRTLDGTAVAGRHYVTTSGLLSWAVGDDTPKTFEVPLLRDFRLGPVVFANLELLNPVDCAILVPNATMTILDADQPAGSVDPTFAGSYFANGPVLAVAYDVWAHLYAGGDFTQMHGLPQNRISRLTTNGVVDTSFAIGAGFNDTVNAVAPYGTNFVAVGGAFTNYDGRWAGRVALLQPNGAPVPTFSSTNGADGTVRALTWSAARTVLTFTNSAPPSAENDHTNVIQLSANQGVVSGAFTFTPPTVGDTNLPVVTNTFSILYGATTIYATNVVVWTNAVSGGFTNIVFGPGAATNLTVLVNVGLTNGSLWTYDGIILMGGLGDKLVIGGDFTTVNGVQRRGLARVNQDGSLDGTFNTGAGADDSVLAVAAYGTNQLIVGGRFTSFNGFAGRYVTRVNVNGAIDPFFQSGPGLGPDAPVHGVGVQADGSVIIVGEFITVAGVPRNHVARLRADGSIDLTFDPGLGANAVIRSVVVQADGMIVLAGDFTLFDGAAYTRIVRLTPSGAIDVTFNPGTGADDLIRAIAVGGDVTARSLAPLKMPNVGKIVGGTTTTIDNFPYQVAILFGAYNPGNLFNSQGCGGSILNDRWILCAAHCMLGEVPGNIAVAVGVTTLSQPQQGRVFAVDQIIVHPQYNPATMQNDMSLLHLTQPIQFGGPYVAAPVPLVTPADEAAGLIAPGVMATITGWGTTSFGGTSSDQLRVGAVPITATSLYGPGQITPDMIMAGFPQGGIDTCQGDSGGPLVVTNAAGLVKQAGVVSFGNDCALAGYPGVYARVSFFYDWIVSFAGPLPVPGGSGPILTVTGNKLAVGGDFTTFNGQSRPHVAVLDANGSVTGSYDPAAAANVAVNSVAVYTNAALPFLYGKVVAGGDFTSIVGVTQNRVARLNANGTIDTNFNIGFGPDQAVRSVVLQPDGRVIVAGDFTSFNGFPRNFVARLQDNGAVDGGFNVGIGPDNSVNALALQPNGRVLIGGSFNTVYGVARSGIARLTANGAIDTSFNPGSGANVGAVKALALQADGRVLVGGDFISVSSAPNSARVARLLATGAVDSSFASPLTAGSVSALAVQADGKILIGGSFRLASAGRTNVNLARLNADGSVDATFNTGAGANDYVSSLLLQPDGRVLVVGSFTLFNGQFHSRIVRLRADGSVDPTINFGLGANNFVSTETLQQFDGKILVGGAFTEFDTQPRLGIARLLNGANTDAGMIQFSAAAYSATEDAASAVLVVQRLGGLSGEVRVNYATQDGTAVSTGANADFTAASGTLVFAEGESVKAIVVPLRNNGVVNGPRSFTVQLATPTGGSILGFPVLATVNVVDDEAVIGFTSAQYTVLENGGAARITVRRVGGANQTVTLDCFTTTNGTAVPGIDYVPSIARLVFDPGVTVQTFFVPVLDTFTIEPPRTVLLVASNLTGPAILGIDNATLTITDEAKGAGVVTFTSGRYAAYENSGLAQITVKRTNGFTGTVSVHYSTTTGTATAGADFAATNGVVTFFDGETEKTFSVALFDDNLIEGRENVGLLLSVPTGGAVLGQANAALDILDDDGNGVFGFSQPVFDVIEGTPTAAINVLRDGGTNGTVSVLVRSLGGTATPNVDYGVVSNVLVFGPTVTTQTLQVPITDDTLIEALETVEFILSNPTGGATIGGPGVTNRAVLQIQDNDVGFSFTVTSYSISETNPIATVTVERRGATNVPAAVTASAGSGTAIVGLDFVGTNTVLNFLPGEFSKPFSVRILDDTLVEGDESVALSLLGAANLGPIPSAQLIILDNDSAVSFTNAVYTVTEPTLLIFPFFASNYPVTVVRYGDLSTQATVDYAASDGTGHVNTNYLASAGTIVFLPGESNTTFFVPLLDNLIAEGDVTVNLALLNPSGTQLGTQPTAVLVIQDNDRAIGFSATNYTVGSLSTNATITVVRKGSPLEAVSATFITMNGTASFPGDYSRVSNVVSWIAGDMAPKTVQVPVFDDGIVQGIKTVLLLLVNPSTNAYVDPGFAILNIVDNAGRLSFAASSSFATEGQDALVTLLRTGGSNGPVSVSYAATGGTATPGADFLNATGSVSFADGQTVQALVLPIVNDGDLEGLETLRLQLLSPQGGARLGSPDQTTLTIVDSNLGILQPAGTALIAETAPANGRIDPNETVTVQFGFRNVGAVNTVNLQAILLATNGVVMTNGAATQTQNYGTVVAGGPVASRPYTFRATGTNGGRVVATFVLKEGNFTNGVVSFLFSLGSSTVPFANANTIAIVDNAPASPYPSVLNVSGVNGTVSKLTVTLSGLTHPYVPDIDMVLVGPNGQNVMLMSDAGGFTSANNVNATFDDAAAVAVPFGSRITNGVYRPANYEVTDDPFPAPGPANPPPAYGSALSLFNGTDPNGDWKLFIVDDTGQDAGSIVSGWSLNISVGGTLIPVTDLSVQMAVAPNPVSPGGALTYTVAVTNHGPGSATGVFVTNFLPAEVIVGPATSTRGTVANVGGNVMVANVGSLAIDAGAVITIQATAPSTAALLTITATVVGGQADQFLANNTATAQTAVTMIPTAAISLTGGNALISWPANGGAYVLMGAPSLTGPWTDMPGSPVLAGGRYTMTLPAGAGTQFFRLRWVP
ncbi:MAG: trypsin-like serine protease [Verrucomicrobia bacterium]|nr:trypsin-like serine protease [Verrucomicrobiota bacterium]